ncbi:YVTN family beta-propeller protein [Collimonas sp. PA-H2]|uniref:YncE family protein n=1 Tax=Collimonas sp. PA-H2 TaxID=1881062 RepID=UPI000C006BE5|nr:YncE family protein [Collimonas sp. PA-H2]PFH08893.1 YVTN family beta-propeller protein [Collimonas sp. PA-H2]
MKNFTFSSSAMAAACALAFLQIALAATAHAATQENYKIVSRFPVTGVEGWDYIAVDSKRDHLFVSRSDHVQVIDTRSGEMVANIADTAGVHGVAIAQDLKLGFTTNGRADTLTVFELDSLKTIDTIKAIGAGPDSILYYQPLQRIYSFNGKSQSVTIVDAVTRKVIDTLPVSGQPEFAVSDSLGHVFFNVEDKNEIAVIDAQSSKIVKRWTMAACDGPSGLAIDDLHHRLFSVCGNKKMMVVDAISGKTITTVDIGDRPDAAAFDPATGLVFVSNGGGTLTVVHEDTADKYTVRANLATQKGARTLALNPESHLVYLVSGAFGAAPAPTPANPRPRAPLLPDTFNVLVAAPN